MYTYELENDEQWKENQLWWETKGGTNLVDQEEYTRRVQRTYDIIKRAGTKILKLVRTTRENQKTHGGTPNVGN